VIVGVVVLILIISALSGGGGSHKPKSASATSAGSTSTTSSSETSSGTTSHHTTSAPAASPAETSVVVLNGTETAGLAHHLSIDLQQSGYTQATAQVARPPGVHSTTLVEYASGHRADAQHVAQTLGVSQVQPLDAITTPLAGSASVLVIAGADQAALAGSSTTGQ
jgi:cytoskeletal protein RodZ